MKNLKTLSKNTLNISLIFAIIIASIITGLAQENETIDQLGDNPDFPADQQLTYDLNGLWDDNGHKVSITHKDSSVVAHFIEPRICEHRDETGDTSQTDLDFTGTLDGNKLIGEDIYTCSWGKGNRLGVGIVPAHFEMTISQDGNEMSGTFDSQLTGSSEPLHIFRLNCFRMNPNDFGLPGGNVITSEFNVPRVYRKDGTIVTVTNDYVLNPDTDKFIRRHKGLDYSSRDDNGRVTPLPFKSGVTGIVDVVEGSPWNTINVKLPNGNIIQYLHASRIDVRDGDTVTSSTVLGLTGRTGADQIHLHVQARNARGNIIDLDCAQT